ncbi:RNA 2',3'-cyclic phosphodiesterase [Candidatus Margulisiibacteriota bacterium]
MKRVFVGIAVTDKLQRKVAQWQADEALFAGREILLNNLHLTLIPPWDVEENELDGIMEKIAFAVKGMKAFDLRYKKIVPGPMSKRPRLMWANIQPDQKLSTIKGRLDNYFGVEEERKFLPHLTLLRFKKQEKISREIKKYAKEIDWIDQVVEVTLFESFFSSQIEYVRLGSVGLEEAKVSETGA